MFFYFQALHIIGFVSWFAGLFYLVRLFVYHVEAEQKPQPEQDILKKQYSLMEWKLYRIITNPAMIITVVFGSLMLIQNPDYFSMGWMVAFFGRWGVVLNDESIADWAGLGAGHGFGGLRPFSG